MVQHAVPTTDARRGLNRTLMRFREEGPSAVPVLFGAHRRPEAVILPFEAFEVMSQLIEDLVIAAEIRRRDAQDDGKRVTVEELADELGLHLDR